MKVVQLSKWLQDWKPDAEVEYSIKSKSILLQVTSNGLPVGATLEIKQVEGVSNEKSKG